MKSVPWVTNLLISHLQENTRVSHFSIFHSNKEPGRWCRYTATSFCDLQSCRVCLESQPTAWIFSFESAVHTVSSLSNQILISVSLGLHKLDCLNSGVVFLRNKFSKLNGVMCVFSYTMPNSKFDSFYLVFLVTQKSTMQNGCRDAIIHASSEISQL